MTDDITSLDLSLSVQEAKEVVKLCILNEQPIMLWGGPGIGKSDLVHQIGKDLGRPVIDIRLALMGSEDIKGYPYRDEETNKMKFAIANEFPTDPDSNAIIFFDEINAAVPTTQNAMYQLILDRKIGEYELPKGVSMVAAGNRESDRGGTFTMPKPLENRFSHVEVSSNVKQWLDWAISKRVHPDIVGFISKFPEKLNTFDPGVNSRSFATPRSWAKANKLICCKEAQSLSKDKVLDLVSCCIGVPVATEFVSFQELTDKLPDPMEILSVPEKQSLKLKQEMEMSVCFALLTSLLYKLRELLTPEDQKKAANGEQVSDEWYAYANNFFRFLLENEDNLEPEFVCMAVAASLNTYDLPIGKKCRPLVDKILEKYSDLIHDL